MNTIWREIQNSAKNTSYFTGLWNTTAYWFVQKPLQYHTDKTCKKYVVFQSFLSKCTGYSPAAFSSSRPGHNISSTLHLVALARQCGKNIHVHLIHPWVDSTSPQESTIEVLLCLRLAVMRSLPPHREIHSRIFLFHLFSCVLYLQVCVDQLF